MASEALARVVAARRANPYTADKTVAQLRAETEAGGASIPLPSGASHRAVDAGGVPAEWITMPGARDDHVFLFMHGGGYYRGSVAATRATAARISAACAARCLSIDYRLAPEHPFPAAVEDALASYGWLLDAGVAPGRIVVGGISAGGGLCLSLLLAARAQGVPLPAGAVPMSAWTDLSQSGETFRTKADVDPSISKPYLDRMAAYYLAGADPRTALASPLFADLDGLPPMLVQVGTAETMLDDSVAFAARAEAAGVTVTLEQWDDMVHGWHGAAHVLPEGQQAIDRIGEFFRARTA
ncbi:MAG: alpha/beta hydrolase fold domain-containing protein [Ectothiorhodospiraceae bacterium]|nr:alpha/beta hydrolase fold domain-containing protein [Ectothiorhodospiraceae bacterium]